MSLQEALEWFRAEQFVSALWNLEQRTNWNTFWKELKLFDTDAFSRLLAYFPFRAICVQAVRKPNHVYRDERVCFK